MMTQHGTSGSLVVTRRALLKRGLLAGLGLAGASLLAACQSAAPAAPAKPADSKPASAAKPADSTPASAAKPAAQTSAPAASAKPYAGKTITAWLTSHVYANTIKGMVGEFEERSGMKVSLELLGFDIHNQRADLELSSNSGSVDVMNLTFIFSGKWIEAGWCTDLTPLLNDPNMTRSGEVEPTDFTAGAMAPFKRGDKLFGLPWVAETTMLMYRTDVFKDKGIAGPPKTFDEMVEIAKKVNSNELAGNLTRGTNGLHWVWPNYLFGYGGTFLVDPPKDMTPALNSKESVAATTVFDQLATQYGVPGSMAFQDADSQNSFNQGRAAMFLDALGVLGASLDPQKSKVADKVSFALPPAGPAGFKPQIAAHALFIPSGVKDKGPGFEFVKWATSKDVLRKTALDGSHVAVPRTSILSDPAYDKKYTWGGAKIGELQSKVLDAAGAGYMTYRTLPEFPQLGARVTIALTEISSKQKSVEQSLNDLQTDAIGILKQAGHQIKG
ncbi:MAG: extracellular solute-binding protein [Chloroflexi bacterium]|nr:extracellular solute-binding protein [Chloroflexota bacterium]